MTNDIQISVAQSLTMEEILAVHNIWNSVYPKSFTHDEWTQTKEFIEKWDSPRHFSAKNAKNEIVAWMFIFNRENERWFSILVDNIHKNKGLGTKLINLAKQQEDTLNGWVIEDNHLTKINGEHYHSPLDFYLKNEFRVLSGITSKAKEAAMIKIRWTRL